MARRHTALFVDHTFPVDPQLNEDFGEIVWKRPSEFIPQTQQPSFIDKDGFSKFDVDQGNFGDCWFLSAIATVASHHPDLFKDVVPLDQDFDKKYTGKFRFNFWSFGKWQTIEIDDRLPTSNGQPLFCKNNTNPSEQWPSLIEKAYAKFYGSYEAIDGGWSENAFVDLTGGIGHYIDLKKNPPSDLYKRMLKQDRMNTLMGSGTQWKNKEKAQEEKEKYGIVCGHAYSITKVAEITDLNRIKHQLIRLMNPWGNTEWKGAWNRRSDNWEEVDAITKRQFKEDEENGEFWMLYEDWLDHFEDLYVCYLPSKSTPENRRGWNENDFRGSWTPDTSAGKDRKKPNSAIYWTDNTHYVISTMAADTSSTTKLNNTSDDFLTISESEGHSLVISLMRKVNNSQHDHSSLSFDVFKVTGDVLPPEITSTNYSKFLTQVTHLDNMRYGGRELSCCLNDAFGTYIIVPLFAGSAPADYLLRVYSQAPLTSATTVHATTQSARRA